MHHIKGLKLNIKVAHEIKGNENECYHDITKENSSNVRFLKP